MKRLSVAVAALLLLGGCMHPPRTDPSTRGMGANASGEPLRMSPSVYETTRDQQYLDAMRNANYQSRPLLPVRQY